MTINYEAVKALIVNKQFTELKKLFKAKPEGTARNKHEAAENKSSIEKEILHKLIADPEINEDPIVSAIQIFNELKFYLIKSIPTHNTPLAAAARNNKTKIIRALIETQKVYINQDIYASGDEVGEAFNQTALKAAIESKKADSVKCLLEMGAKTKLIKDVPENARDDIYLYLAKAKKLEDVAPKIAEQIFTTLKEKGAIFSDKGQSKVRELVRGALFRIYVHYEYQEIPTFDEAQIKKMANNIAHSLSLRESNPTILGKATNALKTRSTAPVFSVNITNDHISRTVFVIEQGYDFSIVAKAISDKIIEARNFSKNGKSKIQRMIRDAIYRTFTNEKDLASALRLKEGDLQNAVALKDCPKIQEIADEIISKDSCIIEVRTSEINKLQKAAANITKKAEKFSVDATEGNIEKLAISIYNAVHPDHELNEARTTSDEPAAALTTEGTNAGQLNSQRPAESRAKSAPAHLG